MSGTALGSGAAGSPGADAQPSKGPRDPVTADAAGGGDRPNRSHDRVVLLIVCWYAAAFVVFGFLIDTQAAIFRGLIEIVTARGVLITDYLGVGGLGAAFVNAGALTLCAAFIYRRCGAKMTGASVACLFLLLGFALFGKNLLNVWFVVLGVWLYVRVRKERFANHINTAFFGAALAPLFSETVFGLGLPLGAGLPLGIATSLVAGFFLAPVAVQLFKAHQGFNLYNIGFTAGIVGTLVVALYGSFGLVPTPVMVWTTGNNLLLGGFLSAVFLSMLALGWYLERALPSRLRDLMRTSGQAPSDYVNSFGIGAALANMGLCGAIGMAYILGIGGDLNGPVIGALFTLVGFGAFGKHPRNVLPVMAGVYLGSLAKPWAAADPSIQLAALLSTTLAPIAGQFGWHWGIVAGLVHSSAALSVGSMHAGLNLYNNGFAGGIVAAVLVPVIAAVRSARRPAGAEQAAAVAKRESVDDHV